MDSLDAVCRQLEHSISWVLQPVAPVLQRVDRYLNRRDASPLGQTLVICSPMLIVFFVLLAVIDLR
jgi:hypothetical protein